VSLHDNGSAGLIGVMDGIGVAATHGAMSSVGVGVGVGVIVVVNPGRAETGAGAAFIVDIGVAFPIFVELFWIVVAIISVTGWLAWMLATGVTVGNTMGAMAGWLNWTSNNMIKSDRAAMMTTSALRSILPQRFII